VARSIAIRRDADSARTAADSLRDEITRTVRDASTSLDACTQRAAALGELCAAVTESHRALAEKADRHTSDLSTLIQAWPK
jgi:predicted trehalose synthase